MCVIVCKQSQCIYEIAYVQFGPIDWNQLVEPDADLTIGALLMEHGVVDLSHWTRWSC